MSDAIRATLRTADLSHRMADTDRCPSCGVSAVPHKGWLTCPRCGRCVRELRNDERED